MYIYSLKWYNYTLYTNCICHNIDMAIYSKLYCIQLCNATIFSVYLPSKMV